MRTRETVPLVVVYCRGAFFRTVLRNNNYETVRHLRGNSPKLLYQYILLKQSKKIQEYLKYFPEHIDKFNYFKSRIHLYTINLYINYIDCFIKKVKPLKEYPYNFKTHMYALHGNYLNDLKPDHKSINKNYVIKYINKLEPERLMYVMNYPL